MITSEALLVRGFGLKTATPVQRALCRARDGLPLRELRQHPDVIAAFGGTEAIERLPSERGIKPAQFWLNAAPRTYKTGIAICGAVVDAQAVDVSALGPGEQARTSILSLKLDLADVPYKRAVGLFDASELLRGLLASEPNADTLLIRHPSGKLIEMRSVAGGKAAGSLASRWCSGLVLDEASRMNAREDGAVTNIDDALSVAHERMLPGAQIASISAPWSPSGRFYDTYQEYFGKPTDHLVVARMTGPQGNPVHWTPERLAKLAEQDPVTYRIVADCEFLDPRAGPVLAHRCSHAPPRVAA